MTDSEYDKLKQSLNEAIAERDEALARRKAAKAKQQDLARQVQELVPVFNKAKADAERANERVAELASLETAERQRREIESRQQQLAARAAAEVATKEPLANEAGAVDSPAEQTPPATEQITAD